MVKDWVFARETINHRLKKIDDIIYGLSGFFANVIVQDISLLKIRNSQLVVGLLFASHFLLHSYCTGQVNNNFFAIRLDHFIANVHFTGLATIATNSSIVIHLRVLVDRILINQLNSKMTVFVVPKQFG